MRILIVDDMLPMRAFMKATVKSSVSKDLETDEAANAEAAKTKLQVQHYDLVLCDWNMPGMKGSELLQWMRSEERLRQVPFIMVTAHNDKEIIMEAIKAGVNDFVLKPITAEVLSRKIIAALRLSAPGKEEKGA